MYIQQIYTGCLAQASYYIESMGEAVVIDPIREPEPYVKIAAQRGAKIKYVFETHFHADFVSGHIDLADKTGALIVFGPKAKPGYPAYIARHHERFPVGNYHIEILHTPGHTIESSCFLLLDENEKQIAVFTGDTLFVGDVGRPDLMSGNLSKTELASMLYYSLHGIICKLDDEVIVYPGHGAGSACGKNLGIEKYSTIADEKKKNYALQPQTLQKFITAVTSDLPMPPAYFFKDASINIIGARHLEDVIKDSLKFLNIETFSEEIRKGALVLDCRSAKIFSEGFIPNSINIGLNGDFAPWVGQLIDMDANILFITEPGTEMEVVKRLARIGYENIKGTLAGGINMWVQHGLPLDSIENVDAYDFNFLYNTNDYTVLDVRKPAEVTKENIARTHAIPLAELQDRIDELDKNARYIIYCVGGYRSMIAASILMRNGIKNVLNVTGGINSIKELLPAMVAVN